MFLYLSLLGAGVLIGLDQLIKWWAAGYLSTVPDIRLIDGVLHLLYRENYGAAFSILQHRTGLLVGVTTAVLIAVLVLLVSRKVSHPLMIVSLCLIFAGGVGNLIDRVLRGFVVDYIYFVPINFPVFNLADCCVVSGTILLVVYLLLIEPRQERRKKQLSRDGEA